MTGEYRRRLVERMVLAVGKSKLMPSISETERNGKEHYSADLGSRECAQTNGYSVWRTSRTGSRIETHFLFARTLLSYEQTSIEYHNSRAAVGSLLPRDNLEAIRTPHAFPKRETGILTLPPPRATHASSGLTRPLSRTRSWLRGPPTQRTIRNVEGVEPRKECEVAGSFRER